MDLMTYTEEELYNAWQKKKGINNHFSITPIPVSYEEVIKKIPELKNFTDDILKDHANNGMGIDPALCLETLLEFFYGQNIWTWWQAQR
jgi:hypothetical protein